MFCFFVFLCFKCDCVFLSVSGFLCCCVVFVCVILRAGERAVLFLYLHMFGVRLIGPFACGIPVYVILTRENP